MADFQIFQERLIFLCPLIPFLLTLFFIYKWLSPNLIPKKNFPPSPPKLPIIGNLHQLGSLPFRSLQTLSEKHGDLMLLHLGSKPTLVVSSAELAYEVLKTHDIIFAGRPNLNIFKTLLGNGKNMVSSPYGEYWRQMRSICMVQLMSHKRVRSYRRVREEEVALMMDKIKGIKLVNMSEIFMSLSNDLICRISFGKKYGGDDGGVDFNKMVDGLIKLLGGYYIGDFISWLSWINKINGVDAKVNSVASMLDHFLERILQDHSFHARRNTGDGGENQNKMKNFVDVLLEAQRNDTRGYPLLDRQSIKCLIQDTVAGGTETTAIVLEWTMSELIKNPRVMQVLQKEVSRTVIDKEIITDDDLERMSYLKAVYKETLRLHLPAPLLIPHECTQDIKINGYDILAGTQVIINAWGISRNPKYWKEPENFYPERFLDSTIDFKGHDFEYIPFGSGRRICPGIALATANVQLVIANLIYRFDWSLPDGAAGQSLDMTEAPGITVHRNTPLLLVPSPRIY